MMFIEMNQLQMAFGRQVVLDDVNLDIPKGELFGLLGPSGSGKTTLVKIMIGMLKPDHGMVTIGGVQMPSLRQMKKIGYMAQSDALYSELTGRDNLDFFAQMFQIPKAQREERIQETAAIVDLTAHLDKQIETYSGGMKRRMSLAISLLHEPELLILDEPTVGIDPLLRESIWADLKKIQAHGTTIVITTHVMEEAAKCDRLALLRDGLLIAEGSPEQLEQQSGTASLEAAFLHFSKPSGQTEGSVS